MRKTLIKNEIFKGRCLLNPVAFLYFIDDFTGYKIMP